MDRTIIELMDDMHLSSRDLFLNYYYAMQSNNTSSANSILLNNPSLANQITNSQNINPENLTSSSSFKVYIHNTTETQEP